MSNIGTSACYNGFHISGGQEWTKSRALSLASLMDNLEYRYRTAGLLYHKIPYQYRRSLEFDKNSTHCTIRLSSLFETSLPRAEQPFFHLWFEIGNLLTLIVSSGSYDWRHGNLVHEASFNHNSEYLLHHLINKFSVLDVRMGHIERIVRSAQRLVGTTFRADLLGPWSKEGILFRDWVHSFLGTEGSQESRDTHINLYIRCLLEKGAKHNSYWTMYVINGI